MQQVIFRYVREDSWEFLMGMLEDTRGFLNILWAFFLFKKWTNLNGVPCDTDI